MKTRTILILTIQTFLLGPLFTPASGQTSAERPQSLTDCLGRKFEDYETLLGAPTVKHTKDIMLAGQPAREIRTYGNKETILFQVEQPEANNVPTWIVVRFAKKAATWQDAFRRLQILTTGVTLAEQANYTTLRLRAKDGSLWQVLFSPKGDLMDTDDLEFAPVSRTDYVSPPRPQDKAEAQTAAIDREMLIGEWKGTSTSGWKGTCIFQKDGEFRTLENNKVINSGKWTIAGGTLRLDGKAGLTILTLPLTDGKLIGTSARGHKLTLFRDASPSSSGVNQTKAPGSEGENKVPASQKASALQNSSPFAPSQLIGKTQADCESILGKPSSSGSPKDGRSFVRYDRVFKPGLVRIEIEWAPNGSDKVSSVWYHFPKGTVKTLAQAFTILGIATDGAKISSIMINNKVVNLDWGSPLGQSEADYAVVTGVEGRYAADWTPAARSNIRPEPYRHRAHDSLAFR